MRPMTTSECQVLAWELRRTVLEIIMAGGGGHIGGDMSEMEILVTLYFRVMHISPENPADPLRDRFLLSKGHCVEALYAVLAEKGFFPREEVLARFSRFQSPYIGHPSNLLPGIEMCSGSLGHGLPIAVGMALAGKMDDAPYRVYTLLGDGELAEGSVWEGAMSASHYRLDNLCAIVDRNMLQISGPTEEVMGQEDLAGRFSAFGWHAIPVDGHDLDALLGAFQEAEGVKGRPTVILARTIKGRGSPLMENRAIWHHRLPSREEYLQIAADLTAGKEAACREPDSQPAGHL